MPEYRNFSIIAHIDHGKSTLADRLIQHVGLVDNRHFRDQILDSMDLERERGITIKSHTVTLPYRDRAGRDFELNLIDTPGHVDFSYEVSRALASCDGVLLVIDASQGVEAQTLANLYSALEHNLTVIPVINKIDLLSADVDRVKAQIETDLGLDPESALLASAKEGIGIEPILEAVVERIPPPGSDSAGVLRALIFDARYDPFRGTIVTGRVFSGSLRAGDTIRLMWNNATYKVEEVGVFALDRKSRTELSAGSVGYIIAGIKAVSDVRIGDTLTSDARPAAEPLPGFKLVKPVVFSSLYPIAADDYPSLVDAMDKFKLNDASLVYQKDASTALGMGFRCGFLGLLHLEIVQERLEREFGQSLIMTSPSVQYRFTLRDGTVHLIDNPQHYPDPAQIFLTEEPYIRAVIILPDRYLGQVMKLSMDRRGVNSHYRCPSPGRLEITVEMPLAEVIFDFHDRLKTITQGYGSFDYEIIDYRESQLVRLDILLNAKRVDALSVILHQERARPRAVQICDRLRDEIPRHMFKIAIQGAIGGQIIARSTITPFRKDVTAKCYGGDISRKRKLLDRQKKGKKRMKMVGEVEVPQGAFMAVLRTDEDE